ncbi:MAG: phenylalanine--tRNA ligase subunit beta [Alphaproteobacteria bacterium]|nr:phenylalanine--tRNA ligase subunit beta [Alphaproteobacteria bacterium]
MKFSLTWLKRHLETTASVEDLTTTLTNLGLEVEGVEETGGALKSFKVARILKAEKHPNADKLQVCTVDIGEKAPVTVVCGAPNARANLTVVFAPPGTTIPYNGMVLTKAKVRDIESAGMLCSKKELNLGTESEGIWELPEDAPVGMSLAEYLALNDIVIEVGITPNRPDCLGVRGIARELAVAKKGTLKSRLMPDVETTFSSPIWVTRSFNRDTLSACPHFTGRLIRGVKNGPSPEWLQKLLQSVGLKSISKLVDVTNFFSHDLCRPLHVFDADTIEGNITVRLSKSGESMKALDDKEYSLDDHMTVIADDKKILALGGIMGGQSSGCTMDTTNVFLESAYFDPIRTAKTGRTLSILSDARHRFERGIDPFSTRVGLDFATQMIIDLCGGEASDMVEAGAPVETMEKISLDYDQIKSLIGISVPSEQVKEILDTLGCAVIRSDDTGVIAITPSWRGDLKLPEDLIEEVVRVYGYHHIPATPLPPVNDPLFAPLNAGQKRVSLVRHTLAQRHMMETVSWSMVGKKAFALFGGDSDKLRLVNPITEDLEYMRPSLLSLLLEAAKKNISRGFADLSLFEVGPIYKGTTPKDQETVAGGLRSGKLSRNHWKHEERSYDIFDVKQDALSVLKVCGLNTEKIQIDQNDVPSWMHPYRTGRLCLGPKNILGYFGEVHPGILKTLGIKAPVMAFEVFLESVPYGKNITSNKGKAFLPALQSVERDLAFIVDKNVSAKKMMDTAQKAGHPLLSALTVFDVYEGHPLEQDKKSLAIRFYLQAETVTLTDADIHACCNRIIETVQKELGGILRDGQ